MNDFTKKEKLKYIGKIDVKEGIAYPRPAYKNIENCFVRKYYGVFSILIGLNPCARDLMEYLTEVMNEDNIVRSDEYTRKEFVKNIYECSLHKDGTFITYSDSNIKKAFQLLVERKCLIKVSKSIYKVNPEFYFRGTGPDRLTNIKLVLEFQKGVRDVNMTLIEKLED